MLKLKLDWSDEYDSWEKSGSVKLKIELFERLLGVELLSGVGKARDVSGGTDRGLVAEGENLGISGTGANASGL